MQWVSKVELCLLVLQMLCKFLIVAFCDSKQLPNISNGQLDIRTHLDTTFPEGTKASLKCQIGYIPSDPFEQLVCRDGVWVGDVGLCRAQSN